MNTDIHDEQDKMNPEHPAHLGSKTIIAIGSNLGDCVATISRAFSELQKFSVAPIQKSSLWRSTPVDCPPGSPDFINAVIALEPLENESPESLLAKLQQLEIQFGRHPKIVINEPRLLDLDLITYKTKIRDSTSLTLPHPRWHQRRFVLEPLNEIAPHAILTGQTQTIAQLLAALDTDETLTRL
jgi:2-amino-4-hydroxy-6-hydroxymethyldihydropteridine diphosphokinase